MTTMFDITRKLRTGHPNWPGDTPLTLEPTAEIVSGSSVNLMRLETSTHCGTHLDAPFHYQQDGGRLGTISLDLLVGDALLLRAAPGARVSPAAIEGAGALPPRVLFATGQPDHWSAFPEAFTSLTAALIRSLAARGVRLVGTDAPSVDDFASKDLPVHRACAETGIVILEGLALAEVPPGYYRLVCLPLNLPDADAAPARAILLPLETGEKP